jgi:hypothetical protein
LFIGYERKALLSFKWPIENSRQPIQIGLAGVFLDFDGAQFLSLFTVALSFEEC